LLLKKSNLLHVISLHVIGYYPTLLQCSTWTAVVNKTCKRFHNSWKREGEMVIWSESNWNQPSRPTQPPILSRTGNEYRARSSGSSLRPGRQP